MPNTILNALESHFKDNKPFLKNGYCIRDLSSELGVPIYQISAVINQVHGKNFNEFINEYRVDHLTSLMGKDPMIHQYTLEALGQLAGFQSRNAFISAVKRRTGRTPSELFGRRGGSRLDAEKSI
jgi:AraC-like DNA-binding protein